MVRACIWICAGCCHGAREIRGVRRPEMSDRALRRIEQGSIPVIVIFKSPTSAGRRRTSSMAELQKPLSGHGSSPHGRHGTERHHAEAHLRREALPKPHRSKQCERRSAVGQAPRVCSVAVRRRVLPAWETRSRKQIEEDVEVLAKVRDPRSELREVFTLIATNLGGLDRLHQDRVPDSGAFVRELRKETLLASNAVWRALAVALHDANGGRRPEDGDRTAQGGWRVLGVGPPSSSSSGRSSTATRGSCSPTARASTQRPTSCSP